MHLDSAPPIRRMGLLALLVALQVAAALFFLVDAWIDLAEGDRGPHVAVEGVIAIALIVGVGFGAMTLRQMVREASLARRALVMARSAMGEVIVRQFSAWGLTGAESDVALFLLKGFDIGEIATLRGVATGTVRAQLAGIYAKAGVGSQAQLMSHFLDALIDAPTAPDQR